MLVVVVALLPGVVGVAAAAVAAAAGDYGTMALVELVLVMATLMVVFDHDDCELRMNSTTFHTYR